MNLYQAGKVASSETSKWRGSLVALIDKSQVGFGLNLSKEENYVAAKLYID